MQKLSSTMVTLRGRVQSRFFYPSLVLRADPYPARLFILGRDQ